MTTTMPISQARKDLNALSERLKKENVTVEVIKRGKPVLAILSWDKYEAIIETLEIVSNRKLMSQLRKSIREMEEEKTISWEEAKVELES